MKWCQTNIVMDIFYIKYVNPKNKGGLTPLHMATINIQFLKYVNIVLQKKFKKRWLLYRVSHMYLNDFRRPLGGYEVIIQKIYLTSSN